MEERFYVDKRTGCVAIRDRSYPDPSLGLNSDLPDVVLFFGGIKIPGTSEYTISPMDVAECERLCGKLNSLTPKRPDNPAVKVEMEYTRGIKVTFESGIYQYYSFDDIKDVFNENQVPKQRLETHEK